MKKLILIALGISLGTLSCNLDSEDNPIYSFEDFENLFNLAYNNTRTYINGYYMASEVSSDEMIPLSSVGSIPVWERLHQHSWTPSDQTMQDIWNEAYEGVSLCILALNTADDNSTDVPANFIAELRALRAYYYYLLLDSFGGVSILQNDFAGKAYPPRSSSQELFDYIETELTEALPDLSESPVYGRITQTVANAILAKLYLNAETYTGTPQWEKCQATCQLITEGSGFSLLADYFDNFATDNHLKADNEVIFFNIFNAEAVPTGPQMNLQSRSIHFAHFGIFNQVRSPYFALTPELYNSFDVDNDRRAMALLVGPQYIDFDETASVSLEDTDGMPIDYTVDIPNFPTNTESTGVRVLKYQFDPFRMGVNANNDFAIFRLADFILMQAEAENELGNVAEAIELINRVRTRGFGSGSATLEDTGFNLDSMRDLILKERGNELFWEGFRRQDLIRHGKFCEEWTHKPVDDDCEKRKLFPIPQAVIDVNSSIEQNPGY
jgi:hypothetical protein